MPKIIIVITSLIALTIFFQNCSGTSLESAQQLSGTNLSSSSNQDFSSNSAAIPMPKLGVILIDHASIGNASVVTRFVMKVTGTKSGDVRACTNPTYNSSSACTKDSEFVYLRSAEQWSYDAASDTYSVNQDVTGRGFPMTEYFTRYILPNGDRFENRWSPIVFSDSSSGNGTYLNRVTQTIKGVKSANLRGCTGPKSLYNSHCRNDSDFVVVAAQNGWSYNGSSDQYSMNLDVTSLSWPQTEYFTRYILPNGLKTEVIFTPSVSSGGAPAAKTCTWAIAVFGPSAAPPKPSASCSQANQGAHAANSAGQVHTCMCY